MSHLHPDGIRPGDHCHQLLRDIYSGDVFVNYSRTIPRAHMLAQAHLAEWRCHPMYQLDLCEVVRADTAESIRSQVQLTPLGLRALADTNVGLIWSVRTNKACDRLTRLYWQAVLDQVFMTASNASFISWLPRPQYADIHSALSYYIMQSETIPKRTVSFYRWIRLEYTEFLTAHNIALELSNPGPQVPRLSQRENWHAQQSSR